MEHVRISNIIGVQLKTSYTRANDEIKCLLDVGSFTLVGDYKLEGLYYGEEDKYHEATVVLVIINIRIFQILTRKKIVELFDAQKMNKSFYYI